MAMTMHLDVVSAEESLFSGAVQEVIAPSSMGDLGIMPRHSQLISTLKAGELRYKTNDGEASLFIAGGILAKVLPLNESLVNPCISPISLGNSSRS